MAHLINENCPTNILRVKFATLFLYFSTNISHTYILINHANVFFIYRVKEEILLKMLRQTVKIF